MNEAFEPALEILRGIAEQKIIRRMWRSLPFLVVLASLTLAAQWFGWLDRYEAFGLDVSSILHPSRSTTRITIVAIDDEAYQRLSNSQSPFSKRGLAHVLGLLARAHPLAVGVDILTSDRRFASMSVPPNVSIAWVQEIQTTKGKRTPVAVLGGRAPPDTSICKIGCIGGDDFRADSDGVVRRTARAIETQDGNSDTFAWSILGACAANLDSRCSEIVAGGASEDKLEERLISWSTERASWPHVLAESDLETFAKSTTWDGGSLRDQIVILGGYYTAGNDVHSTPIGIRPGPEIWAQILQDEFDGRVGTFNEVQAFAIDIVSGLVIVAIYAVLEFRIASLISLVAVPVGSLVASIVLFDRAAFWFNFAPMFFGTIVHQVIDHGRVYIRLRELHPDEAEAAEEPRRRGEQTE